MLTKHSFTSSSICAQSVPACGHVSWTNSCGAHSAGSIFFIYSSTSFIGGFLYIFFFVLQKYKKILKCFKYMVQEISKMQN